MTRKTRFAALTAAVALATSLAACGGDDNGGSAGNYCDLLEEIGNAYANPDFEDPNALDDIASQMQRVADAAPDDIKADWEALADGFGDIADVDFENLDLEDPAAMDALQGLEELGGASDRVGDHIESECGDLS
ncbi:hypothetical protein [Phytoactinopolyspora mesophila]|uniref:Uncharacterized protein n=1 Tax=Phytoactinopolyspora mesophila TaxID=2650750 RepID=A0A7K3M542_9ACTN|nr:hypothetical protein [Phytoactinopolyspora mesophila]NDL58429.1 hypothetical protein [Phytoactinopolyspora mesophila]